MSERKRDVILGGITTIIVLTPFIIYREIRGDTSFWERYLALAVVLIATLPICRFASRRIMSNSDTQKPASSSKRDMAVVLMMSVFGITLFFTYREIRGDISLFEHYLVVAVVIVAGIPVIRFLTRKT